MKKLIILLCFGIIPSLAGFSPSAYTCQKEILKTEFKKRLFMYEIKEKPFSRQLLWQALIYEGIEAPEIVFKQCLIETGHFTSQLFIEAHNCFGMRLARVRETTAIGEFDYHARYEHWYDSVKDYKLFQEWYASKSYDLQNYYAFLKKIGYATDKKYIVKLKSVSDIT